MHIRQVLPSAYLCRMTVQVIDSSIFQGEKEGRVGCNDKLCPQFPCKQFNHPCQARQGGRYCLA